MYKIKSDIISDILNMLNIISEKKVKWTKDVSLIDNAFRWQHSADYVFVFESSPFLREDFDTTECQMWWFVLSMWSCGSYTNGEM